MHLMELATGEIVRTVEHQSELNCGVEPIPGRSNQVEREDARPPSRCVRGRCHSRVLLPLSRPIETVFQKSRFQSTFRLGQRNSNGKFPLILCNTRYDPPMQQLQGAKK